MSQTKAQLLRPDLGDVIDFDSSTLYMDGADNRVGIRNTNPQYELDVTGTVRATNFIGAGSTTIADWIVHDGDTNTKIGFPAADEFEIHAGGGPKLRITSAGKIGIIQSSPYSDVDITSSVEDSTGTLSSHGIRLAHIGATDEEVIPITAGFLAQQDRARAGIGFISKQASSTEGYAGAIGFYTRSSADGHGLYRTDERVRIDTSGNIGAGTNSPSSFSASDFVISKSANAGITVSVGNAGTTNTASIFFAEGTGGTGDKERGAIKYKHGDDYLAFHTDYDERLRIDSSGQIGVGNIAPKTWSLGKAIHVGNLENVIFGESGNGFHIVQNAYYNSGYKKVSADLSSIYTQWQGKHIWYNSATGSADAAITWVPRLQIEADGSVHIDGPTAAAHGLRFTPNGWNGYDNRMGYCGTSGADFWWSSNWNPTDGARDHSGYATNFIRQNISSGYLSFGTGGVNASATERFKIDASGHATFTRSLNLTASGDNHNIIQGRSWTWTSNGLSTGTVRAYIYGDSSSNLRIGTNGWNEKLLINSDGIVRIKRAVATSLGNDSIFLGIGDTENGSNVNRMIGFGYVATLGTSVYPASMGYTETHNSGNTKGALTFNTRNTTGATDVPVERLRIDSDGHLHIKGQDHEIRWYRDDGTRYGAITYDGGNFNIKNPYNDHTRITTYSGTEIVKFRNDKKVVIDNTDGTFTIGGDNVYNSSKVNLQVGSMSQTSATTEATAIVIHDQNSKRNGTESAGSWVSGIRWMSTQINGGSRYGAFINQDITYNNFSGAAIKMRSDLVFGTRGDAETGTSDPPTEKMRIHSAGYVTKPKNVHFNVRRNGHLTGHNANDTGTVVIMNYIDNGQSASNASDYFNTSTGLFTAPVDGMYLFMMGITGNYSPTHGWLLIAGSRANFGTAVLEGSGSQPTTMQMMYKVTAGQTVGFKFWANGQTSTTVYDNNNHTYFKGYLLG